MWGIPAVTAECIARMEAILDRYARPSTPEAPSLCWEETSKQRLKDIRPGQPAQAGEPDGATMKTDGRGRATPFLPWNRKASGGKQP